MDFETTLKIIFSIAAVVAIPVAAYAAIQATRAIWSRHDLAESGGTDRLTPEAETLKARLAELEAGQSRILELEERLDFAERMLVSQHEPPRPRLEPPPGGSA